MSDDELREIKHFGFLCADPHTVTFDATPEEQARAAEILKERAR